jgi:membrane protein involved in colicin uptake
MIIHGNYAGGIFPKPDWNQQDASKADFIKGKEIVEQKISSAHNEAKAAGEAAENAQTAADNAQTAAENAQTAAENAEKNAKDYADSLHKLFSVNLPASGWSASSPYTQTVAVEGILGTDTPHYSVVYSSNAETALAQKEAFAMVDDLDTADGSVTFTCFEDKPEVNIPIQMEVNR